MTDKRSPLWLAAWAACLWSASPVWAGAEAAATNTLNGITLRGERVCAQRIVVQSTNLVDFAAWTTTEVEVQHFDVVVASLVPLEPSAEGRTAAGPAPQATVKLKTKSSAEWTVTGDRRAFVMTEDAPLMYASTAGAKVALVLEVLRDEPPKGHPYKPKRKVSPTRAFKRM